MLRDELLPLIIEIENEKIIFEINDAVIRIAASIKKKWLRDFWIELFPWPASIPHLNVIDNLCEILEREVYDQEK